eukprot:scaffold11827_cov21-Tisochrysis_lutea.AAC.1
MPLLQPGLTQRTLTFRCTARRAGEDGGISVAAKPQEYFIIVAKGPTMEKVKLQALKREAGFNRLHKFIIENNDVKYKPLAIKFLRNPVQKTCASFFVDNFVHKSERDGGSWTYIKTS